MSKIGELMKKLCPNGVEYKEIWQVTNWDKRFNSVPSEKQKIVLKFKHVLASELKRMTTPTGNIKLLSTGVFDGYTDDNIAAGLINDGEVVAIPSGGSANIKYYKGQFVDSGNILCGSSNINYLNIKYFYYYLLENKKKIENTYRGSGVKHPNMAEILDFSIPTPPLEVQEEIVRILDTFTALISELKAELEARKKQYEYYRNKLLSFEGKNVEWKTLGEVCEFKYGFTAKARDKGDTRFIRITDINSNGKLKKEEIKYINLSENNKEYLLRKGDVLIARTGATYGKTILYDEEYNAIFASFLIRIRFINNTITPKYFWHFAQSTKYWEQAVKLVSGGAQQQFNANVLKLIKIPAPSIELQHKVLTILDKFDTLVNDLSIGIPAEIEARQKQYEYYRGKLLSFKEINNE